MSFVESQVYYTASEKELRKHISQSYDLIEFHFEIYDSSNLTLEQCYFVSDYIFSIYDVDDHLKLKITKQIKEYEPKQKTIFKWRKEDFRQYLTKICLSCKKREHRISVDDIVEYIDIELIKKIEDDWANITAKNSPFITKSEVWDMIKQELKCYKINYQEVHDYVQHHLSFIYKYVFFEDFVQMIIQIHKMFPLQKKIKMNKQKCGCVIF